MAAAIVPVVSRRDAMRDPTRHQYLPGIGHVVHAGEPDIPAGAAGGKNCLPPAGAANDSVHVMRPSHGAPLMRMRWLSAHRAWMAEVCAGNRMAHTADFLSRAGWEYVGKLEEDESKKKRRRT